MTGEPLTCDGRSPKHCGRHLLFCLLKVGNTTGNTPPPCCSFGNLHKMSVSFLNITLVCFHAVADQMLLLRKVLQSRRKRSCCRSEETQQRPHLRLLSCVCKTHARWALQKTMVERKSFSFSFDSSYCPARRSNRWSLSGARDHQGQSRCVAVHINGPSVCWEEKVTPR